MSGFDRREFGVDELEEALVLHGIANSNVLTAIITHLVDKQIFGIAELESFSRAFSKPLELEGARGNKAVQYLQDSFETQLAQLMSEARKRR